MLCNIRLKNIFDYLLKDISYFLFKKAKENKRLNIDNDIMPRLCINDYDVVNAIYAIYYDLLERENKRRLELDNKAFSLMGIAGVCITLIFGLGGILIERIKDQSYVTTLAILYLGAFLFGMASLFFALLTARTRSDFKTINDEDVFSEKEIKKDILSYKRFLIAHYWQINQNDYDINEEKGRLLKISFRMFFVNIVFLFFIVFAITNYLLDQGGREMSVCNNKGKPPITSKPTGGKIETLNVKIVPKPTSKPSAGLSITESKK